MSRYFFVFFSLLSPYLAWSQAPTPLSLQACIDYALKHNYNIRNAAVDVLIQQAQNKQTAAAAYPHINGKAELDDFLNPTQSFVDYRDFGYPRDSFVHFAFTLPYASQVGVTGSQLLFDGSVFVALKARKAAMELARLSGDVTEESVRYNVYKAYNSIVIVYRQFDIISKSLAYARSLQHDIEVTQQNGFAEKIDVERTSVQVNNLETDSIRVRNSLTLSEDLLKYQIGMDINTSIALTDTNLEDRKQKVSALLTQAENYERVPEYKQSLTALTLNEYNLKRYQMSAIPSINAFGSFGYNFSSPYFSDMGVFPAYLFNSTIGIQMNVSIFNGRLLANQKAEARLNIEKAKNNIEGLKQAIDFQAASARSALKNATLETQSQHRNLDLANDVLDLARRKYKAGVGSNLEVTQAQTDMLNAQNNYFSALLDIINAEADLRKALGLLK